MTQDGDRLLRQDKRYEHILLSDRAAVDIGVFTLKVVMTINAGALIAYWQRCLI